MKLAGLGKLLSMLYDDKMDIYRTGSDTNDDLSTDVFYKPEPVYVDVKCCLSFSSDDTGADSEVDREPIRFNPKLFCETSVDLKAGDYVVVRRYSDDGIVVKTYEGRVAQPSWYSTHQEANIRIDEGA